MIAVFAPDLMDGSRLQVLGGVSVRPPFVLPAEATTLLVDLDRLSPDTELPSDVMVVGFGAHVDADRHRERLGPGGRFLARSALFRDPLAAMGQA